MDNQTHLTAAMRAIDESFNGEKPEGLADDDHSWRKVGLVLFQFGYGKHEEGLANYISNGADRGDMIKFLRETADRFEHDLKVAEGETLDRINEADVKGIIGAQIDKDGGLKFDKDGGLKLDAISQKLADEGKLIEAGWIGYKRIALPPTAPAHRVDALRTAFMAGALHLFSTMMDILEPGDDEPTEADYSRMDKISAELQAFTERRFGK